MCMHAYVCLHVEASRRIVLVAVILGSGEGAPLGEPCRHGSFPTSSAGWLNVWGHLWREQRVRLGVGTLAPGVLLRITRIPWLQKSSGCLECPLKGQAGFEVRASFKLPELAQLHTCVPRVSSSLRPVPRVPPYMQPCALRRGLRPHHPPMAKSSVFASVSRPQALATFWPQPVPTCGCDCVALRCA